MTSVSEPDDESTPEPRSDDDVREAEAAERRASAIAHGRRIGGAPGAIMAGAMLALRDILEPPRDDQPVAEVEAPGDPHDVDRDGVALAADELGGDADVAIAPQPRRDPIVTGRRRSRRR